MAITATIALNPTSGVQIEAPVTATVTVSNSGGSPVNVNEIVPRINFTGDTGPENQCSVSAQRALINPANQVVPAGGSTKYNFQVKFHGPSTKVDDSGSGTYDVSCDVAASDGSNTTPTAATITVHPVLPIF